MRGAALVTVLVALLGLAPWVSEAEEAMPDTPEGRADLLLEASGLAASLASMAASLGDQAAAPLAPPPERAARTGRRWLEVSRILGDAVSTLRSRWKKTLDNLRDCVRSKLG